LEDGVVERAKKMEKRDDNRIIAARPVLAIPYSADDFEGGCRIFVN
jgi:hypothetical protein